MAQASFIRGAVKRLLTGTPIYYIWVAILLVLAAVGILAYAQQIRNGLER
jgi:hypothetical protein